MSSGTVGALERAAHLKRMLRVKLQQPVGCPHARAQGNLIGQGGHILAERESLEQLSMCCPNLRTESAYLFTESTLAQRDLRPPPS